jgi:hypothetical protein
MVFDTAKLAKYLLVDEMPLRDGLRIEWDYMMGGGNKNLY